MEAANVPPEPRSVAENVFPLPLIPPIVVAVAMLALVVPPASTAPVSVPLAPLCAEANVSRSRPILPIVGVVAMPALVERTVWQANASAPPEHPFVTAFV